MIGRPSDESGSVVGPPAGPGQPETGILVEPFEPSTAHDEESGRFDVKTVSLMSGAHFAHDAYPAFTGVLLPLLIPKLGIGLAEAGLLASAIRWTTLLQPILGYFADRVDTRYFVIAAPATTAICVSLIGIAPSYFAVFALLLISGVSHAAFHPAAAGVVTRMAGGQWGKGMSFFMTGGELGRALGPLYIAAILTMVGLEWSWIALFPGVIFSFLLYHRLHRSRTAASRRPAGSVRGSMRKARRGLVALSVAIVFRSIIAGPIVTFLPTLAVTAGAGLVYAGTALAMYEIGGTIGAFLGGTWSDRFGRRAVLAVGLVVGLPTLALGLLAEPGLVQLAVLAIGGFFLIGGVPVQLVTMQELLPENRAMAVGISYFMTTGGAIASTIGVGILADAIGLRGALLAAIVIAVFALPAILMLPGRGPAAQGPRRGH